MKTKSFKKGSKVVIGGNHPWRGYVGEYQYDEMIISGLRALVTLSNGRSTYVPHSQLSKDLSAPSPKEKAS